jgi:hypothetical protein
VRVVVLAVFVVFAAAWAVAEHYGQAPPPLLRTLPPPAPTYDADAGEMPVPDFLEKTGD